ncbi:flagellar biosynthetic protein FliP [Pseudomonas lutea]|uniref:Flagellar biosynthetic protein FliP n=1 Tax=Pseudomonas lutea TaxID=243924 RepID=A0A9X8MCH9_9PSED|nr:flagellar biosynthetic protein FliP [Pseudomonas lutea]
MLTGTSGVFTTLLKSNLRLLRNCLLVLVALAAPLAFGQENGANNPLSISAITMSTNANGQQEYSVSLQILLIMTALSFIPAFVMLMTSFTRIIIVFAILRQALGLQTTPSNQVLIGLALFLTLFIMAPVFDRINNDALQPYMNEQLTAQDAIARAEGPIKDFMLAQTRQSDLDMFMRLSKRTDIATPDQAPLTIVVPAFVTSELKTAFQIGFMIFIPFLVIDLVVASVLMGMGMMMLSPMIISLPFKLMLFVLVDGWSLIMGTLAGSFGTV